MKNHILFLAALIISLICLETSAQTSKGKFLVGGQTYLNQGVLGIESANIAYTTTKTKDDSGDGDYKDRQFSLNFTPKVGYFIIDNLALGLEFFLASSFSNTTNTETKTSITLFSAGPFVRYYIPIKKVIPYAEAMYSLGPAISSSEWEGDSRSSKFNVQVYGVGLGLAIPLGEKASFDVLAGYSNTTYIFKENNENNSRGIVGTIGLKLGLTIFLGSTE